MLTFTAKETVKIKIHQPGIDPNNFNDKGLPTDIHVVKFELNNGIVYDAVRAHSRVDIFDIYHDKLKALNGKVLDITSGYGNIRPNLYTKSE
jgi:hypothetical protein